MSRSYLESRDHPVCGRIFYRFFDVSKIFVIRSPLRLCDFRLLDVGLARARDSVHIHIIWVARGLSVTRN